MSLVLTNSWPATIPLPFYEFKGAPTVSAISSTSNGIVVGRRSRFEKNYTTIAVSWVLTVGEFDAFKTFLQDDLGNSASQFEMELRYPKNTELTTWAVRFIGGYKATWQNGVWTVEAELQLVLNLTLFNQNL